MTAWIVVESMFGNTRRIADIVAHQLDERVRVVVLDAATAPTTVPDDVSFLAVGGPTHVFSMSRTSTRGSAVEQGSTASTERGIREWLDLVDGIRPGLPAVAFDTRVHKRFVPGSAARVVSRRLVGLGCVLVEEPVSFYVEKTIGPLNPGEEHRAIEFGLVLVRDLLGLDVLPESAQESLQAPVRRDLGTSETGLGPVVTTPRTPTD